MADPEGPQSGQAPDAGKSIKLKLGQLELEGPLGQVIPTIVGLAIGLILPFMSIFYWHQPSFLVNPMLAEALNATVTAIPPPTPYPTYTPLPNPTPRRFVQVLNKTNHQE